MTSCGPRRLLVAFLGLVLTSWIAALATWSTRMGRAPSFDPTSMNDIAAPSFVVVDDRTDDAEHRPVSGEPAEAKVASASVGQHAAEVRVPTAMEGIGGGDASSSVATPVEAVDSPSGSTGGDAGRGSTPSRPRSRWARVTADAIRRDRVRAAMKGAYGAYARLAFGADELAPASGRGTDDFGGIGATLIDALDTLWIMGLRDEFDGAVAKLKEEDSGLRRATTGRLPGDVSVFETNIRVVGGLLSAFDLSGDEEILAVAEAMASKLAPAFKTSTGVPRSFVNLQSGQSHALGWTAGASILADFGTMHLEFATLSNRTGNPTWGELTERVFDWLRHHANAVGSTPTGLFPVFMHPDLGRFSNDKSSFGALGDSFYEYLIKCWRSLGGLKHPDAWRSMFDAAIDAMQAHMLVDWNVDPDTGQTMSYVAPLNGRYQETSMEHLACFLPGALVLAADDTTPEREKTYVDVAERLARTCVEMYRGQPTGLAPDNVRFDANARRMSPIDPKSIQRPETVESLFYLFRRTGQERYRTWAWEIFEAMERHYRTPSGGWQGVVDVQQTPPRGDDKQQSFLLAETMKYLYLIFSDGDDMHLDEWVFNTEAHPVKVTRADVVGRRRRG